MKALNFEVKRDIFTDYALSSVEMNKVRGGGDGDGDGEPIIPPIKI